eukprot:TRINITY_DN2624_c3_g1_i1.p1 TRINITY_DN2624_c3_g1~~TRINITY_DN2624_c3_g1_i1.p1  ORF type:complete len:508 (+),score=38.30 TRINITY_DN2624_c3_g1_i1:24-1526(+)
MRKEAVIICVTGVMLLVVSNKRRKKNEKDRQRRIIVQPCGRLVVQPRVTFIDVGNDVIKGIMSYLTAGEVLRLAPVSRRIAQCSDDDFVWQGLYLSIKDNDTKQNMIPHGEYKEAYKKRVERSRKVMRDFIKLKGGKGNTSASLSQQLVLCRKAVFSSVKGPNKTFSRTHDEFYKIAVRDIETNRFLLFGGIFLTRGASLLLRYGIGKVISSAYSNFSFKSDSGPGGSVPLFDICLKHKTFLAVLFVLSSISRPTHWKTLHTGGPLLSTASVANILSLLLSATTSFRMLTNRGVASYVAVNSNYLGIRKMLTNILVMLQLVWIASVFRKSGKNSVLSKLKWLVPLTIDFCFKNWFYTSHWNVAKRMASLATFGASTASLEQVTDEGQKAAATLLLLPFFFGHPLVDFAVHTLHHVTPLYFIFRPSSVWFGLDFLLKNLIAMNTSSVTVAHGHANGLAFHLIAHLTLAVAPLLLPSASFKEIFETSLDHERIFSWYSGHKY